MKMPSNTKKMRTCILKRFNSERGEKDTTLGNHKREICDI